MRRPGESTFESVWMTTVRSRAAGWAASRSTGSPSRRSALYGSSSISHSPAVAAASASAARRSALSVRPVGFWKVGIR